MRGETRNDDEFEEISAFMSEKVGFNVGTYTSPLVYEVSVSAIIFH